MNFRDVEQLSAYLDGQLPPADVKRLEARLTSDAYLRRALDELRSTRNVLRLLPRRRAPRSFALRPGMRSLAAPMPRGFPVLRLASAGAMFLFVITLAINTLAPFSANRLASAAAPAFGMGGGSGGAAESTAPPAAATNQGLLAVAPTAGPESSAPAPDLQAQAQKNAPPAPGPVARTGASPVPLAGQLALVGLAIAFGLGAWYLRSSSLRKFRRRWVEK